jgi:hypothetical protein
MASNGRSSERSVTGDCYSRWEARTGFSCSGPGVAGNYIRAAGDGIDHCLSTPARELDASARFANRVACGPECGNTMAAFVFFSGVKFMLGVHERIKRGLHMRLTGMYGRAAPHEHSNGQTQRNGE